MKLHLPVFLCLILPAIVTAAPDKGDGLILEITAPEKALVSGAPQHGFRAVLHNRGEKAFDLVLPGDGSDVGWRSPTVTWLLDQPDKGAVAKAPALGRCGTINEFKATELFTLKPGGSKDLGGWLGGVSFPHAGTYDLQLRYMNDPKLKQQGLKMPRQGEDPYVAVKKTDANTVTSAPLRLVVGAGKAALLQGVILENVK